MEWSTLLSTQKLAEDEAEPHEFEQYPINAFEKDYNKIVSSAVFRRLQDKTQVFPLDKSDFVRTRLTHSIEVSTIARQLGIMVSKNTTQYRPTDIDGAKAEGISSVLLCSGLLHDLGNPPFGHFGETVIGEWFQRNLSLVQYKGNALKHSLTDQMIKDLECFEGNAQAFRILAKAQHNSEINLSAAVISTLMKYPTNSLSFDREHPDIKKHKPGYFGAERDMFHRVAEIVGTGADNGTVHRHPLTFLMEAADDIAYATADLEDAYQKDFFTLNEFIAFFEAHCPGDAAARPDPSEYYSQRLMENLKGRRGQRPDSVTDHKAFMEWIVYVRRWLMYVAVYRFSRDYRRIMQGEYSEDLFYDTHHAKSIKLLKGATREFVFGAPGILKLELSAQTILSFLLDKFVVAALYYDYADDVFKPSKSDEKYMRLFPSNYKKDYTDSRTGEEGNDLYLRLLMVTDYISGMTDSYARTLYRELSGIE